MATWTHLPNGSVFAYPGRGWECSVFLIAASLVHALIGDGASGLRRWPLLLRTRAAAAIG